MSKTAPILALLLLTFAISSCRLPDNFGFYQPITMSLKVPDGPPEYKAGWYAGCRSVLQNGDFANATVYRFKGSDFGFGSGVYQHDPLFQTAWAQGWFACDTHIAGFVDATKYNFALE